MELSSATSFMNSHNNEALDVLKTVDSLSINYGFSLNRAFDGTRGKAQQAKYGILNDRGQILFYAFEESDPFQQICCTNERAFTINILDNQSREIIRIRRELQTCSGCCCCSNNCESCMQKATVEFPPGSLIGSVRQLGGHCTLNYLIKDANDQTILTLVGPCCICNGNYSCGCQNSYILYGSDHQTEIGTIEKLYPNSTNIHSANPVAFTLTFPVNLETKMKMILLGALFFIDIANYRMVRLRS